MYFIYYIGSTDIESVHCENDKRKFEIIFLKLLSYQLYRNVYI